MKLSSLVNWSALGGLAIAATIQVLASPQAPIEAKAASPRSSFVTQELYSFNHPLASQLSGEVATKMSKMAVSPFAFYRGTAHIFYRDMKNTVLFPASQYSNYATSTVWLEGDMHLQNLGGFRDDAGNDVFDTTDFDEGYFGSYGWDVRRMAVSILLAAKENGIGSSDRQKLVQNFVDSYLAALNDFRGNDTERTFRLTTSNTSGVVKDVIQAVADNSRTNLLAKYTAVTNGKRWFQTTNELQSIPLGTFTAIQSAMGSYIQSIPSSKRQSNSFYTLKDARLKLGSGTGSLGRYRYYLLIEGDTNSNSDDVILEMKQEQSSAVAIAAPNQFPSASYGNHQGQRVAMTLKAMLNNADDLTGYTTVNGIQFFLREKSPFQVDFDYTKLTSYDKFNTAVSYFAKIVAKNHAIADQDYDPNLIPYSEDKQITDVVTNKSGFRTEILNFALDYATQVEYDYASFKSAYQNGQTLY
jgi:uncharacterized protein (DUF2252 family)